MSVMITQFRKQHFLYTHSIKLKLTGQTVLHYINYNKKDFYLQEQLLQPITAVLQTGHPLLL